VANQIAHHYINHIVVDLNRHRVLSIYRYSNKKLPILPLQFPLGMMLREAIMIRGIKFASVPVRDQEKALQFYTKKLGFEIVTDQPFGDQRWIELSIPGAESQLVLFTPPGHETHIGGFQPIVFWTDDIDKTYAELNGRGVQFTSLPKKEPWGTSSIFTDEDGNQFVLSSR
jgi:catechol 2,3-dioxygenase-like lactoylglutathione lyase family enzyme